LANMNRFDSQKNDVSLTGAQHRHCKCGAVYRRTESTAKSREINSFGCSVCGKTMETWKTACVPS
jgi:hypothetical protein